MKRTEAFYMPKRGVSVRMMRNIHGTPEPRAIVRRESEDHTACGARNGIENAPSLAMVYAPIQEWREIYDLTAALDRGTLFGELDLPLEVAENCSGGGRHGF